MKMKLIYLLLSVIFLSACNDQKIEDVIIGDWTIDTIYYKNVDIRLCINLNVINFSKEGGDLPITENDCGVLPTFDRGTFWKIIKNKKGEIKINFDTQNEMFNGEHHLTFKKDEVNKLLKMEISSDSLFIICRKALFNFDGNIATIDNLVKITHPAGTQDSKR